jgi:hypothetical protein
VLVLSFTNFKKRIEKFLLDESGGMSKKSVLTLGLISSVAAFSSVAKVAGAACDQEGGFHCYKNEGGKLEFFLYTSSSSDSNGGRDFQVCVDGKRLFDSGILSRPDEESYVPVNPGIQGLLDLKLCDHLSSSTDCHLDDHFNSDGCSDKCEIAVPDTSFHSNALNMAEVGSSLTASHAHDISTILAQKIECHLNDHWDGDYWDCGDHYSQTEDLGVGGSKEAFGGTCPDELSLDETGRFNIDE